MTIVCDQHIPFLVEAVQTHWPDVRILPSKPDEIDASFVREADVLVVRTRTQVNEVLLAGSRVQLVCTATIGYDHIDTDYCDAQHIHWTSCPGCNAQAVCDYIEEALEEIIFNFQFSIFNSMPTIGIVGVGHVGSLVANMAERKGYKVLLNDPPKGIGISLDEIAQNCDIITFHVPLDNTTFHMCDEAFLSKCKPNALIINAARGGVIDERALVQARHPFILDTWENEPNINSNVLSNAFLASMHIAGYSLQGKRNATQMCLDTIAKEFQRPPISIPLPVGQGDNQPGWLKRISDQLKAHSTQFEQLRKAYPLR